MQTAIQSGKPIFTPSSLGAKTLANPTLAAAGAIASLASSLDTRPKLQSAETMMQQAAKSQGTKDFNDFLTKMRRPQVRQAPMINGGYYEIPQEDPDRPFIRRSRVEPEQAPQQQDEAPNQQPPAPGNPDDDSSDDDDDDNPRRGGGGDRGNRRRSPRDQEENKVNSTSLTNNLANLAITAAASRMQQNPDPPIENPAENPVETQVTILKDEVEKMRQKWEIATQKKQEEEYFEKRTAQKPDPESFLTEDYPPQCRRIVRMDGETGRMYVTYICGSGGEERIYHEQSGRMF